jgi:hypothetical protein
MAGALMRVSSRWANGPIHHTNSEGALYISGEVDLAADSADVVLGTAVRSAEVFCRELRARSPDGCLLRRANGEGVSLSHFFSLSLTRKDARAKSLCDDRVANDMALLGGLSGMCANKCVILSFLC